MQMCNNNTNGGLSDSEILGLFDDNCFDPCSVVGSSYGESSSSSFSFMPGEANQQNTAFSDQQDDMVSFFNLKAYLMSEKASSLPSNVTSSNPQNTLVAGPSSEQCEKASCMNRSEDNNLDQLFSIDMSAFSQLQKESGGGAAGGKAQAWQFTQDQTTGRKVVPDNRNVAQPSPTTRQCLFCTKYFSDEAIWRSHKVVHYSDILICKWCKMRMSSAIALRKRYLNHHIDMPRWNRTMTMVHDTSSRPYPTLNRNYHHCC